MKRTSILLFCAIISLLAYSVDANPLTATFTDTEYQDVIWSGTTACEELGNQLPFDDDECITSSWVYTDLTACTSTPYDDPEIQNVLVTITNMTGKNCDKLYYVADPETTLSNYDGLINGALAFVIDAVGVNTPLVYESMNADGIFEAGETWQFIIQDYSNSLGIVASAFASLGIASASIGDLVSSGSIVTPEPTTLILLAAGLLGLKRRK